MTSMRINVFGMQELLRKLQTMGLDRDDVMPSLKAAMVPVQKACQTEVPENEGLLKKSIKVVALKGEPPTVTVRPEYRTRMGKDGAASSAGQHAHLVEFGTKAARPATKSGRGRVWHNGEQFVTIRSTGVMPANPFMQRGWQRGQGTAQRILADGLRKLVEARARGGGR